MKKHILTSAILAAALLAGNASATIIGADFRNESDLPYFAGVSAPKVTEALNVVVGAGVELNSTTPISNPHPWGGGIVFVDLDPITNILTLDSQDDWDFETFLASISNIQFDNALEVIAGVSMLTNDLTDPLINPTLSFTDNSILINYDGGYFDFTTENATFQITTRIKSGGGATPGVVPEPATLALLGLGLLGLGLSRRQKA